MYREIVTKAVVGKGKINNSGELIINPNNKISKVLGCWVINHYFVSSFENGKVLAKGKYDVHVWYGCDNDGDTCIHKQTVDYIEEFSLKIKDEETINESNDYLIKCLKYPFCSGLLLNDDGTVSVKIEKELALDIIGETTLRVQTSGNCEEDWVNEQDISDINVNYLKKDIL